MVGVREEVDLVGSLHLHNWILLTLFDAVVGVREEVDLVGSLHLHNSSFSGLDVQPGPHSASPALQFSGKKN